MPTLAEALALAATESIADTYYGANAAVAGYCFMFDSDLTSVVGLSMPRSFANDVENEPCLFVPVDWPFEHITPAFTAASELLPQVVGQQPYETLARVVVQEATQVLESLRSSHPAMADAILMVICPDSDELWDALTDASVRRLNSPSVYEAWLKSIRDGGSLEV